LATSGLLALAPELGLDLLEVDPVRGRDLLLRGPHVLLEVSDRERAELQAPTLVQTRLDQVTGPDEMGLPERAQPVLVRPLTRERHQEANLAALELDLARRPERHRRDRVPRRVRGRIA